MKIIYYKFLLFIGLAKYTPYWKDLRDFMIIDTVWLKDLTKYSYKLVADPEHTKLCEFKDSLEKHQLKYSYSDTQYWKSSKVPSRYLVIRYNLILNSLYNVITAIDMLPISPELKVARVDTYWAINKLKTTIYKLSTIDSELKDRLNDVPSLIRPVH